jgi:predicted acetyltransferase
MEQLILIKPTEKFADEIKIFRDEFFATRPKGTKYLGLEGAGLLWQIENPLEWIEHSRLCENKETLPDTDLVTATQYIFVHKSDRRIVGMIQFRHYFNDFLEKFGGHIGYCVRPSERRKGYATLMLSECLKEIGKYNSIKKLLLTCKTTNEASRKTIVVNGGVYESTVYSEADDCYLERYWIEVKNDN